MFTYGAASSRKRPTVGDPITVAYDAKSPENATVNSFMGIWAGPLAAAILGSGTLYGGIRLLFYPD